jgi:hypothetical protein
MFTNPGEFPIVSFQIEIPNSLQNGSVVPLRLRLSDEEPPESSFFASVHVEDEWFREIWESSRGCITKLLLELFPRVDADLEGFDLSGIPLKIWFHEGHIRLF